MKYLSDTGLKHLISKIFAKFAELEASIKGTGITTAEIDTMQEEES